MNRNNKIKVTKVGINKGLRIQQIGNKARFLFGERKRQSFGDLTNLFCFTAFQGIGAEKFKQCE